VIPVLLMLVYPGPALAGPAQAPAQRASDTDRDIAADILCAAVGDGRLTLGELDDRLGAALSARTTTELAALIADLTGRPSARPSGPGGPSEPSRPSGRSEPTEPGGRSRPSQPSRPTGPTGGTWERPGALTLNRWALIQSLCPTPAARPAG
jgi:hypothetical protein